MALSDAQIDRFSRQIVLPQIGGRGQERLLGSAIALAGDGELAAAAARYLAAAGVGRLALHGNHQLRDELRDLDPEVEVTTASGRLDSSAPDVLVLCDCALATIDRAGELARPMVVGAAGNSGGWLVVARPAAACASCAARAALGSGGPCGRPAAEPPADETAAGTLSVSVRSATAGAVGSLMSIAALELLLDLHAAAQPAWLQFDIVGSRLVRHPIARAANCPLCPNADDR